jgi:hypothetical protein
VHKNPRASKKAWWWVPLAGLVVGVLALVVGVLSLLGPWRSDAGRALTAVGHWLNPPVEQTKAPPDRGGSSPSVQGPVIGPITGRSAGSDPSRLTPAATPQAQGSPALSTTAPASVPTVPTAAPSPTVPTAAPSPTLLGGFSDQHDLNHYCISLSYEEAYVSTGSALPAYNNWKCRGWAGMANTVNSDQRQSDYIDFGAACRWAYQGATVTEGKPSDPSNAYTWLCYGYR